MSHFTKTAIAIIVLSVAHGSTANAQFGIDQVIGGVFKSASDGIGNAVRDTAMGTGRMLVQDLPRGMLKSARPQWNRGDLPGGFKNAVMPSIGQAVNGNFPKGIVPRGLSPNQMRPAVQPQVWRNQPVFSQQGGNRFSPMQGPARVFQNTSRAPRAISSGRVFRRFGN